MLRCLLVLAALAAPLAAPPAGAAVARSVADTQVPPPEVEAGYQKLIDAANSVVGIHVKALPNARSNASLGQERTGSGVVIRPDGLILTIGYLVLEAETVEVVDSRDLTVPGTVVAYDHSTGFGLVKPMAPIQTKPIRLGSAKAVAQRDRLMVVTGGDEQTLSIATVVSKRRFAGYWEYLIDDAIFTAPPRLDHSGAALINQEGELVGIGSLFVLDAMAPGEKLPGNMFIPIDLLAPILDEMVKTGTQHGAARPWLGVNSLEEDGRVKVIQVNDESPADRAGIEAGDIILGIDGQSVDSLEAFYARLWSRGPAGVDVNLTVLHGTRIKDVPVRSIDRREFMRRRPSV